ncbi:GL21027 [Drosophila persimilis]|uniref:GL21027 n=1 Tax=Drosophila persimilis TaxID=7234 RepID=B4HCL0_DROPE|nr:GL21027 [Drosophila persimilis]
MTDSGNVTNQSRSSSPAVGLAANLETASTSLNTSISMTLSPTDILAFVKQLPTFDGTPGTLDRFITSVEEVIMLIRGTDQTPYGNCYYGQFGTKFQGERTKR